ncbi:peritrophin-48 [Drosophila madeirensis]|uniref:Peritrophin-48 n=2 Tax=Drosophila madeirensis TaxID=30013 RepID=A0AAU9FRN2_DROMD
MGGSIANAKLDIDWREFSLALIIECQCNLGSDCHKSDDVIRLVEDIKGCPESNQCRIRYSKRNKRLIQMENRSMLILLLLAVSVASGSASHDPRIAALCRLSTAWRLLPDERHCGRFYVCTGDAEDAYQEFSCPLHYRFSAEQGICVPGACSEVTSSCNASTSAERIPSDCTRYRRCTPAGAYSVARCVSGSYFDTGRRACLPVAVTAAHQCSCLLPDHATVANPSDCETYYRCESGEAVLVQCPAGQYFESSVGSCLPDTTGICFERPTFPPFLTDHALALDECISTGSRLAPHSRDCGRYYVCADKRVLEMRCPRGQYFDAVHHYCALDLASECQRPESEAKTLEGTETAAIAKKPPPPPEREVAASYDKFSSKFVSF